MVTVDTITETNLIVWEKTDTVGISHYNIYREGNSTGVYNLVGSNSVNQLSQWVDPTADPQLRSWRYKISAVDSCGNESQLSASHKTMHVTANLGLGGAINCSWDYYDGFTYGSYYISRYHNSTGWMDLDTIPSSLTSWTDASPPGQGGLKYSVSIVPPSSCTSTKAQDHNTTRSNRASITGPGTDVSIQENEISVFTVYPNPTNGIFTISLDQLPTSNWSYRILDLRGKLITSRTESGRNAQVNISYLETGFYLVEATINGLVRNIKVVIQ
jgi:trimeric autotransporter adhesin